MTQWRMLAAVAAAGLIGGWLVVLALRDAATPLSSRPAERPTAADERAEPPAAPASPGPAREAPAVSAVPGAENEWPDLTDAFDAIANGLLRDRQVSQVVLPDDFGGLAVPSAQTYLRVDEFYQPAFARFEEAR